MMRGIILAGGHGTRLLPATLAMNKHMIPILNHPMVEYPIKTLKSFGIEEIMLVAGGEHIGQFAEYLGDGSTFGVNLTYRVQKDAGGIAQALLLAEDFCLRNAGERFMVVLGDNIFDNQQFNEALLDSDSIESAHIFVKEMLRPERFGVLLHDTIVEKPKRMPKGKAVTGLYVYPTSAFDVIRGLEPSSRGELEISDVNNWFIKNGEVVVTELGHFWSDAGTPESLLEVNRYVYETSR